MAEDTVTIDRIALDVYSDEYVLHVEENGPWPSDEEGWRVRLLAIQDRVLSACDAAIEGALVDPFPDSVGKFVRVQVDTAGDSPSRLEDTIAGLREFVRTHPKYRAALDATTHIAGLRILTQSEMLASVKARTSGHA